jgi:hypothetical protein
MGVPKMGVFVCAESDSLRPCTHNHTCFVRDCYTQQKPQAFQNWAYHTADGLTVVSVSRRRPCRWLDWDWEWSADGEDSPA